MKRFTKIATSLIACASISGYTACWINVAKDCEQRALCCVVHSIGGMNRTLCCLGFTYDNYVVAFGSLVNMLKYPTTSYATCNYYCEAYFEGEPYDNNCAPTIEINLLVAPTYPCTLP